MVSVQARLRRPRVRIPQINGPKRGGAGTGSRDAIAWTTRTESSVPPSQATIGASRRRDGSDADSPAETDEVGASKAPERSAMPSAMPAAAKRRRSSRQRRQAGAGSAVISRRCVMTSRRSDRRPGTYNAIAVVIIPVATATSPDAARSVPDASVNGPRPRIAITDTKPSPAPMTDPTLANATVR